MRLMAFHKHLSRKLVVGSKQLEYSISVNKYFRTGFIQPSDITKKIDNFPEICVSTFSKNIIQKFSSLTNTEKIAELYTANGIIPVYKIRYRDTNIAFYLSRVGAPACVAGFEEIIALGAKKFVLFGSCPKYSLFFYLCNETVLKIFIFPFPQYRFLNKTNGNFTCLIQDT